MDDQKSYKVVRIFLRVVGISILVFYTIYFMRSKLIDGNANLDMTDGLIIFFGVAILIAVESVRNYVKRRLDGMNK